jgi:hypothetical protein
LVKSTWFSRITSQLLDTSHMRLDLVAAELQWLQADYIHDQLVMFIGYEYINVGTISHTPPWRLKGLRLPLSPWISYSSPPWTFISPSPPPYLTFPFVLAPNHTPSSFPLLHRSMSSANPQGHLATSGSALQIPRITPLNSTGRITPR